MPSIDMLHAATAIADGDLLPVSQNGAARRATRAQVVAGLQPQIALASGRLLGRLSAGTGAPEAVAVGTNLVMQGGTLSAVTTPLNVAALPQGAVPAGSDLVPFAQGGRNVALSYGAFLGGLSGLGTVDVSGALVTAAGGTTARSVADVTGDMVPVEAFGARGDGATDDTAAFAAAVASGKPLRLGAKTYVLNGQFTIARVGVTMLGVPGATVLKRAAQAGNGAWISVQGDGFRAEGVVFDANGATVAVESWGVLVTSQCLRSDFHRCVFRNASGASLGSGLVFQSSDPAMTEHVVRDCTFSGNAAHGLWVQACSGVLVAECRAFGNARYGIVVDYNDAAFARKARLALISGNRCWANQRGISIGNFNATNAEPARWGNANPDAIAVLVANNVCHDNTIYGVAISGNAISVQGNVLSNNGVGTSGGGGVLANAAYSSVSSNTVTGAAVYGIDCGGSIGLDVRDNMISGALFGINCGGGQFVRVDGNRMQDCSVFAVSVNNVETDGAGGNFGMACSGTSVCNNWITMAGAAGGVWLRDGPQLVHVARNHFVGTGLVGNCLWADTDSLLVEGNRYNFSARQVCNPALVGGLQQVVFPDIADDIAISAAPSGVGAMVSSRQSQMAGKIAFVRITAGGSGYTSASITIGGTGSGAVAQAVISDGVIIGAVVSAAGSGYGGFGVAVPVTIAGNGTGATAVASAGLPLPEERRLRVRCDAAVRFTAAGASPAQGNWTGVDITMPAGSDIDWTVANGGWRAGQFSASHTLAGQVRRVAPGEAVGCSSGVGRGSPQGVVAASPGSDWRNLDGGAGGTYWIKQSGTGSSGWVAVA